MQEHPNTGLVKNERHVAEEVLEGEEQAAPPPAAGLADVIARKEAKRKVDEFATKVLTDAKGALSDRKLVEKVEAQFPGLGFSLRAAQRVRAQTGLKNPHSGGWPKGKPRGRRNPAAPSRSTRPGSKMDAGLEKLTGEVSSIMRTRQLSTLSFERLPSGEIKVRYAQRLESEAVVRV